MMFNFYCKRNNVKKEAFLGDIISHIGLFDKVELLCQITGVEKQLMLQKRGSQFANQVHSTPQVGPIESPFDFVQRTDYPEACRHEILSLLTQLIKCLIGEESDISEWHSLLDQKQRSRAEVDD